jgi:hypothetical protein
MFSLSISYENNTSYKIYEHTTYLLITLSHCYTQTSLDDKRPPTLGGRDKNKGLLTSILCVVVENLLLSSRISSKLSVQFVLRVSVSGSFQDLLCKITERSDSHFFFLICVYSKINKKILIERRLSGAEQVLCSTTPGPLPTISRRKSIDRRYAKHAKHKNKKK